MARNDLFWLSHSKVQSFFKCRKQYWFQYLSGRPNPPDPMTAPGIVGKGVHEAMRVLWQTNSHGSARNELDVYLRMPDHRPHAGPGTDAFERAMAYLEHGCMVHDSITSERSWAEQEALVDSEKRGIRVSARIDRVDRIAPDQWQIIDWKTGASMRDEVTDAQLDLGHVAARATLKIPAEATVVAIAHNLSGHVMPRRRELTRADATATMDKFAALSVRIQEETEFEATPGVYCSFCKWRPECPESDRSAEPSWDDDD